MLEKTHMIKHTGSIIVKLPVSHYSPLLCTTSAKVLFVWKFAGFFSQTNLLLTKVEFELRLQRLVFLDFRLQTFNTEDFLLCTFIPNSFALSSQKPPISYSLLCHWNWMGLSSNQKHEMYDLKRNTTTYVPLVWVQGLASSYCPKTCMFRGWLETKLLGMNLMRVSCNIMYHAVNLIWSSQRGCSPKQGVPPC